MNRKKFGLYTTILLLLILPLSLNFVSAILNQDTTTTWDDVFGTTDSVLLKIMSYVFGPPTAITESPVSNGIITIAVWILIFITLGDIIATFSTFSAWVSWVGAFLIGTIAANLGGVTKIIAWSVGAFAVLGAAAVIVGLAGALFAFVVVNLGLWYFKRWIVRRRAMQEAATMEAGGKKIAGSVGALGEVGKAFKKEGFK